MARLGITASVLALLLAAATFSSAAGLPTAGGAPRRVLWSKGVPADPFCPWEAVKFGACAAVLGLADAQAGAQLGSECCQLVGSLAATEAAACLCVAAKEGVLGLVSAEWSVGVELLASACKTEIPDGFKCV
ncbi:putative lipid-binding protein AIR1 [Triticum urartu]|uniref:putative lipid-binding protein AIR1 n=1 Tax=Triticum urartu TaxID=4572 RepID=UPI00204387BC|nr:putative lipid-binding protein AIR1 [Triticum urartu]